VKHDIIQAPTVTADILNFIDGEYRPGTSGRSFPNIDPATGKVIGTVFEADQVDVAAAVAAARAALSGPWGSMTPADRAKMLVRIADEIDHRADEFLAAEIADTGKPRAMASHLDIPRGAANFRVFADLIVNTPDEAFRMNTPDGGVALNYTTRKPKGVIAVISPWNLPLLLMTWKVGPALACGNTVVVKPSEETPRTAALLGEVIDSVGVPNGVYNVVHGFGPDSAGEYLTSHPDVDAITFTGETVTGEAIMKQAAIGLRDISFELGGKNPGIVFADADFEKAVEGISRAAFMNTGQVCLGTERVYVERAIYDRFVAALADAARKLRPGVPDDKAYLGPLASASHRDKVVSYYEKAVAEGATVVVGGGVPKVEGDYADGYWIEPTIWTGVEHGATITREEIFGPCCAIIPFDSEDQVVAWGNDTPYGLCATVWTQDVSKAHRVAAALKVGICWVNSWFLRDLRTAFGGVGQSGIGREGGVHSLEFYTEIENICVKL
jgi:aminomuconate-semialdehyde/2-hydroxymuconate-6-semialdehyde dehydrogenase